jgi:hypothetical protein
LKQDGVMSTGWKGQNNNPAKEPSNMNDSRRFLLLSPSIGLVAGCSAGVAMPISVQAGTKRRKRQGGEAVQLAHRGTATDLSTSTPEIETVIAQHAPRVRSEPDNSDKPSPYHAALAVPIVLHDDGDRRPRKVRSVLIEEGCYPETAGRLVAEAPVQ